MSTYLFSFTSFTDLREGAINQDDFPVVAIVKRSNYLLPGSNGDAIIKKSTNNSYCMHAYLCVLDTEEETEQGVRNLGYKFQDIWNKYSVIGKKQYEISHLPRRY